MPKGITTSNNVVVLCIHVVDERGMCSPFLDDVERNRIDDIDPAFVRCSTNIPAAPHDHIVVTRWNLFRQNHFPIIIEGLTVFEISPRFTSIVNI